MIYGPSISLFSLAWCSSIAGQVMQPGSLGAVVHTTLPQRAPGSFMLAPNNAGVNPEPKLSRDSVNVATMLTSIHQHFQTNPGIFGISSSM